MSTWNIRADRRLLPESRSEREEEEIRKEIELLERLDREMEKRAEAWKRTAGRRWTKSTPPVEKDDDLPF